MFSQPGKCPSIQQHFRGLEPGNFVWPPGTPHCEKTKGFYSENAPPRALAIALLSNQMKVEAGLSLLALQ